VEPHKKHVDVLYSAPFTRLLMAVFFSLMNVNV